MTFAARHAALCAALIAAPLHAQEPAVPLDTVVVSATRADTSAFATPAAISAIDAQAIAVAGPGINLSEALVRMPGITALDRHNYAQDLQVSIRGFGARSTFGIRGVRLIVDGIPATMPDGQGQASNVSLASAERVEVLRGPLALLYGNAAGGVVQVFTRSGADPPEASASAEGASYGEHRVGAAVAGNAGAHRFTLDAARFAADGYREHSAARRDQLNGKWSWRDGRVKVDTVVNVLDQPLALDPLGLTRAQWEADPRQAPAVAFTQDASKTVTQRQVGSVVSYALDEATALDARAYFGTRDLDNKLSVPLAAQLAPTSAGGIVSFDRRYAGAALQASRRWRYGEGLEARVVAALEHDRMLDDRQGYINDAGQRGALRRDEDDIAANTDAMLQASAEVARDLSVIGGVRASRVRFEVRDRYIAPGNPDDSGTLVYRATNPVAGIAWRAAPALNLYANAGRGFETPTLTELSYRNEGTGLNTELRAARGEHLEVGAKWRGAEHAIDAALFESRTRDEIVVDANVGGRSTFRNAGGTRRRGLEVGYAGRWGPRLAANASITAVYARFDDGRHLPGAPERNAFAELVFAPFERAHVAVEAVHVGRIYVDDANSDFAPAVTFANLRAGLAMRWGGIEIAPLLRLENATNRRYAGSVIVNESQRRFFEAAPPRTWMASVSARYAF